MIYNKKKKISKNTAYKTKYCYICRKPFQCIDRLGKPREARFCSKNCMDLNYGRSQKGREYQKQYREQNNDRIKQTQKQCYEKNREHYIKRAKENAEKNPNKPLKRFKVLDYKTKKIRFEFEIRCGVCNLCRAVEKIDTYSTQRHHDEDVYFDNEPLKNTIELCVNCHAKETFNKKKKER